MALILTVLGELRDPKVENRVNILAHRLTGDCIVMSQFTGEIDLNCIGAASSLNSSFD